MTSIRCDCAARWSARSALSRARWRWACAGAAALTSTHAIAHARSTSRKDIGWRSRRCGIGGLARKESQLAVANVAGALDRIEEHALGTAAGPNGLQPPFADAVVDGAAGDAEQ